MRRQRWRRCSIRSRSVEAVAAVRRWRLARQIGCRCALTEAQQQILRLRSKDEIFLMGPPKTAQVTSKLDCTKQLPEPLDRPVPCGKRFSSHCGDSVTASLKFQHRRRGKRPACPLWSKADMRCGIEPHLRFTPDSGHRLYLLETWSRHHTLNHKSKAAGSVGIREGQP